MALRGHHSPRRNTLDRKFPVHSRPTREPRTTRKPIPAGTLGRLDDPRVLRKFAGKSAYFPSAWYSPALAQPEHLGPEISGSGKTESRRQNMLKPLTAKARKPHEWTASDLQILHTEWKISESTARTIPVKKLLVCPQVFQVRDLHTRSRVGVTNNDHVTKLALRLDSNGDLDPILVLPINANRFVVIDGTHRRAAYERRDREVVPVVVFTGTVDEARVAAGRSDNAKRRLEWTSQEKSQCLYRYVVEKRIQAPEGQKWTQKQCAEAADRTERLARYMERKVRQALADNQPIPDKWNGGGWSDDEDSESAEDRLVAEFTEKLAALGKLTMSRACALGVALARHTEQAAMVAKAMIDEGALHEEVFEDFSEIIAEQAEEQADAQTENLIAGGMGHYFLTGIGAAAGAGF